MPCLPILIYYHLPTMWNPSIFFGRRGAFITTLHLPSLARQVGSIQPDFVILQFGANDLADRIHPFLVAERIVALAKLIQKEHPKIKNIFINSELNRSARIKIPQHKFHYGLATYNDILNSWTNNFPNIHYHCLIQLVDTPICIWSHDGMHPNTRIGRSLYTSVLRQAILRALATKD